MHLCSKWILLSAYFFKNRQEKKTDMSERRWKCYKGQSFCLIISYSMLLCEYFATTARNWSSLKLSLCVGVRPLSTCPFAQANYHGCVHAVYVQVCRSSFTAGCTWRPRSFQRLQFICVLPAAANSTQHGGSKIVIARATPQINYFVARGSNLPTELCERAQLETLDFAPFFPQETLSAQFSSASES